MCVCVGGGGGGGGGGGAISLTTRLIISMVFKHDAHPHFTVADKKK